MEINDNNVVLPPISNEMNKLMLKNLHDEVLCNKEDSLFSASTSIKVEKLKKLDVYFPFESVKEEYSDPDDVFKEDKIPNCSILKIKPEKNEQFSGSSSDDVKCMLDPSYVDLGKFNNFTAEHTEGTYDNKLDKTFKEDWTIKNEEVDIKEEVLAEDEIRLLSNYNVQEILKDCSVVNQKNGTCLVKPDKVFKCDKCDYQTIWRSTLKRHHLIHKNPEDVKMFKCDQCDYRTIWLTTLKRHHLRHKNPEDVKMFKCDHCDYQTFRKYNFAIHILHHKSPEDVNMFKCDQCNYQTFRKSDLKTHVLRHKNPEDGNMFKCDQCHYQTFQKKYLKTHVLGHKNPQDKNCFKCDYCDYHTFHKYNFKIHSLRHKNPEDVEKFKCNHCNYQTLQKSSLKVHLLKHKNP